MRIVTRPRMAAVGAAAAASIVLPASMQAIAEDATDATPTAADTVATPTAGSDVPTPARTGTARLDTRNAHGRRHGLHVPERRREQAPTSDAPTRPTSTPAPAGTSGRKVTVRVTSFGFNDNDDGKGHSGTAVIAHPIVHRQATESSGRFDDPITFASAAAEFAPGTMIYVPYLQKYFVMEDDCVACSDDSDDGITHVDLWMGPASSQPQSVLTNCQNSITRGSATIEVDPGSGRPVDSTPMFTDGRCTVHLH